MAPAGGGGGGGGGARASGWRVYITYEEFAKKKKEILGQ